MEVEGVQGTSQTVAQLGKSVEDNAGTGGGGEVSFTLQIMFCCWLPEEEGVPGECSSEGASYHGGVGAGWFGQGCVRLGPSHEERGGSRAKGWIGGQAEF